MTRLDEPSGLPQRPSAEKVRSRGPSGRMAAVVVACAATVVVGVSLLGQLGERPAQPAAALQPATAAPTPGPSPEHGPDQAPEPAGAQAPPVLTLRGRALPTGGTPLPDIAHALPGDDGIGPLPLGAVDRLPNRDRLDFLFQLGDFRDAHWMDPANPTLGSGVWTAGRPFHVREGFINEGSEPLGAGFDVVLYVTRLDGETQAARPATYRYESDYVLRGVTDRCGPTYETQSGPQTCEWFVHDFPNGLPEGRWAIWAAWEAPCRAWIDVGLAYSCADPEAVMSLFASGFDAPYTRDEPSFTQPNALPRPPGAPGSR